MLGSVDFGLQDELLFEVLNQIDQISSRTEQLINAWWQDDVDTIDAVERKMPRLLYERLFLQRNRLWTQSVKKGMDNAPDALVLVGCGHLVGRNSLIRMLEAEGLLFERVI